MCGIWAFLARGPISPAKRAKLEAAFDRLQHRGPSASRLKEYHDGRVLLGFKRLAIVDPTMAGMAPFHYADMACVCNGEIYNYEILEVELREKHSDKFNSQCDTEVILPMFEYVNRDIVELCKRLDGEFAFVIYDKRDNCLWYATDEISMRPIYIGRTEEGEIVISSELIGLNDLCVEIVRVGASGYGRISLDNPKGALAYSEFYSFERSSFLNISFEDAKKRLREIFIQNVKDKIHYGTRDDGFFLSGGIDSSLVAGIAAKLRHPKKIKTFTVGFSEEATDVIYARKVAQYIGSEHHEIILSEKEAVDHLEEIIKVLGTFDQTTVRASTPLYLATKKIKQQYPEIYILYNGELADELQGGYLYFRNAPSALAHKAETIRRLKAVHNYDGLRCDRVCAAFGIEARFPFFSKALLDFVLALPPEFMNPATHKGVEKFMIREAFSGTDYIPDQVLWRTKNALSDATSVKSSWKELLKKETADRVSDEEFNQRNKRWLHSPPDTKEDFFYRRVFEKYYEGAHNTIPYKWLPLWCGDVKDSSASMLTVFNEDSVKEDSTKNSKLSEDVENESKKIKT